MTRRDAREQAFMLIFEMIFHDDPVEDIIRDATLCRDLIVDDYATAVACAVRNNREAIDATIEAFSSKWKLSRIPKVTVSILRLAVCEMNYMEGIPVGAAINEAVELAKKYGGEEDASFVNGVLGGIARSAGGEAK
ncbi:MAG: transcription antitermination factor NusB [Angelakisella sp.]|nr:transcription antitermination factor NusB [Angelakisella sp.]